MRRISEFILSAINDMEVFLSAARQKLGNQQLTSISFYAAVVNVQIYYRVAFTAE